MVDLLSGLNERQKQAVEAPLGPVLVLAGAGSGKTKVLTHRLAYVISKLGVKAEKIIALTFTNKAAKEMTERLERLLAHRGVGRPFAGTFHSYGLKLLRAFGTQVGLAPGFTIFDSDDTLKIVKEITLDLGIPEKFSPSMIRALISRAKNQMQTPNQIGSNYEQPLAGVLERCYTAYQNELLSSNGVDFDDLLLLPVKLMEASTVVAEQIQQQNEYVLVDEYQDTNDVQYRFLRLLAPHENLFVVGDDAQSIYGFRGSNIGNILNFEKDFPKATVVMLEQNYRSTKRILAVADQIIRLNSEQKQKTLWTENAYGNHVWVQASRDERQEAEFVARKIVEMAGHLVADESPEPSRSGSILDHFLRKAKISQLPRLPFDHEPLNKFAVLYRTHAQSRVLEEMMLAAGIPYVMVGGLRFFERKEVKDALAFLRLLQNPGDLVSLKRVINTPPRGVGPKSFERLRDCVAQNRKAEHFSLNFVREQLPGLDLAPKALAGVQSFFGMLDKIGHTPESATAAEVLRLLVEQSGLVEWLRDGSDLGEDRAENVAELVKLAQDFSDRPWREGVGALLEEAALFLEADKKDDNKDAVTLMTLHAAKGLEFDTVFFVGLEEGVLPHSRSLYAPEELAEEIRLAYVGATRARQDLFLSFALERTTYGGRSGSTPSRILRQLSHEHLAGPGREHLTREKSAFADGEDLQYEKDEQ